MKKLLPFLLISISAFAQSTGAIITEHVACNVDLKNVDNNTTIKIIGGIILEAKKGTHEFYYDENGIAKERQWETNDKPPSRSCTDSVKRCYVTMNEVSDSKRSFPSNRSIKIEQASSAIKPIPVQVTTNGMTTLQMKEYRWTFIEPDNSAVDTDDAKFIRSVKSIACCGLTTVEDFNKIVRGAVEMSCPTVASKPDKKPSKKVSDDGMEVGALNPKHGRFLLDKQGTKSVDSEPTASAVDQKKMKDQIQKSN